MLPTPAIQLYKLTYRTIHATISISVNSEQINKSQQQMTSKKIEASVDEGARPLYRRKHRKQEYEMERKEKKW